MSSLTYRFLSDSSRSDTPFFGLRRGHLFRLDTALVNEDASRPQGCR